MSSTQQQVGRCNGLPTAPGSVELARARGPRLGSYHECRRGRRWSARALSSSVNGQPVQGSTCRPRLRSRPLIDYRHSVAPVCHFRRQSISLAISFEHGGPTYLLCVKAAFLQKNIDSKLYAKQAPGQEATDRNPGVHLTINVRRRLYGLEPSTVL